MRHPILTSVLLLALLPLSVGRGADGSSPATEFLPPEEAFACSDGCGVDCLHCPHLEVTLDLLWMGPTSARSETLVAADIAGNLFQVLGAEDLRPEISGGMRAELLTRGWLEASYMGVFDQKNRQSVSIDPLTAGLNSVEYQFFNVTGGATVSYEAQYQSELHSGEFNIRFREMGGVIPVVGGRWFRLRDEVQIFEAVTPTDGVLAQTRNDLVGAQVGLLTTLWNGSNCFRVDSSLKLGVYGNQSDLYADTHDAAGPILLLEDEFESTSFAGELQVTATWWVTPALALRAGYTGLWMNEIMLAPDQSRQFDLNTGAGTPHRNDIAFHGTHVGLELWW